jgi:hypothetical protein
LGRLEMLGVEQQPQLAESLVIDHERCPPPNAWRRMSPTD